MKILVFVILLLSSAATGCAIGTGTNGQVMLDGKEIVSVKLECADFCKRVGTPPFTEKTFAKENGDALKLFRKAIVNAHKMNGMVDYGVTFFMYLAFADGTQKKYVLNVANTDGMNALLVDTEESSQGYKISKDLTSELRSFIYGGVVGAEDLAVRCLLYIFEPNYYTVTLSRNNHTEAAHPLTD